MAIILTVTATEQSTYVITLTFRDEDGELVTPATGYWTLTDPAGNVVNEREDEEITSLASSVDIVLGGLDLALEGYISYARHFTFKGTYNSTLGSGLALTGGATFEIDPLLGVDQ